MSKKTKKRTRKYTRKHIKRNSRKKIHRNISTRSKAKGISLFNVPETNQIQQILVNQSNKQAGNMIPGLRNM